jgi:hypothetical protein
MKWIPFFLTLLLSLAFACKTEPVPQPAETAVESPGTAPAPAELIVEEEASFDPLSISQEVFDTTKSDVQQFIGELNTIIRARDYTAWVAHLGEDYFAHISSPEYLARISEQPRLTTQKIQVTNAQEYFTHVVVPSRANDRVDDIEFVSQRRVKAYTLTDANMRLRLYDLEWIDDGWKIIN